MSVTASAFARAGLIGNPSDGYFGKTIAFSIRNFSATVTIDDSSRSLIKGATSFDDSHQLIRATIKRFTDFCGARGIVWRDRPFELDYRSDIPPLVGLAGSSAIITAAIRALMKFFDLAIPLHELPELILSVERDELGIHAGLQDRVIQVYEGIVYMDFNRTLIESRGYGHYEPLLLATLPPLYVAYDEQAGEASDIPHRNLRERFDRGDARVVAAMREFADLTDGAKTALLKSDWADLGRLINANFDLRRSIVPIAPEHQRMIDAARSAGASAHFAGSGGAICGLVRDDDHFASLSDAMRRIHCTTIRPKIYES